MKKTIYRALDKVTDGRPDKGFEAEKVGFGKKLRGSSKRMWLQPKEWASKNVSDGR